MARLLIRLAVGAVILLGCGLDAWAADAVVLFRDRAHAPQRSALEKVSEIAGKDIAAIWVWSESTPPRRVETLTEARRASGKPAEARLAIQLAGERLGRDARVQLIAAPVSFWEEAPEDLLPSWRIEAGATLRIPVDRAQTWRVRIAGPGYGTWWTDVPPNRTSVVLAPVEAKDRALNVVDEQGEALAAARLSLLDEAPERGDSKKLADYRSNARGTITLRALPDTAALLFVASTFDRAPRVFTARPSSLPSTVVLPPGASVRGTLTDGEGKPVARARVGVRTWIAENVPIPLIREAESAEDGTWRIDALPAGRGEWRAQARGFAPASRPVTMDAGVLDLGTVVLAPEIRVAVEVRNDLGEPVPDAKLIVRDTVLATTNAEGRASIPASDGQALELRAEAEHHRDATITIPVPFPRLVEILLPRAFRVIGRLVDASGVPLPNAGIRAVHDGTLSRHDTDANGRFDLTLDAGIAHELEFRSPHAALVTIDMPAGLAGETRQLGDVAAPSGLVLTGRLVRADDGAAVSGARLWLPRSTESGALMAWAFRDVLETVSGADGTFELGGLSEAPFLLRIDAPGLAPTRKAVMPEPGTSRMDLGELRLHGGVNVTIRIDGDTGEGAEARLDLGGRGLAMDTLRALVVSGRASLAQVPAGDAIVTIWRDRDLLCREQATISGGWNVRARRAARGPLGDPGASRRPCQSGHAGRRRRASRR